ncbi:proline-, glutamic acid- and leucine-rich protein 1 [Aplochiton taeniatus]
MATSWMHGSTSMRLTEGLVSVLKEERPEYLPALLANYREHGVVPTQSSAAIGGLVGFSNAKLGTSKTRFEGLCLLSVLVKDSSSEVFQQHCLSWLRSLQQVIQSQAPLPTVQLAVSVLQDLLQYSSQLPELAREVGLNAILGILTSLLGLKSECYLVAMEGMTACMTYYPRACGSLRDKLGAYFLCCMDRMDRKVQEVACECYGRLPCLGGLLDRGGVGGKVSGWTNQIHCLLATANGLLTEIYQGSETEGTVQYEGPGVQLSYALLDDTDPLFLLQLQHRYRAICLALKYTLSVDPASAVHLPVRQGLNLVCRALAVSSKAINVTGDGSVRLLVLPAIHNDALEVLHALITAVRSGMVQYSSVLQRLFSQTLSAWTPLPESSVGQQRAYSAVRVSVYRTLELWARVGGASSGLLQGSPTHSELLFAHLLGDITPGADAVKLRGAQTSVADIVVSAGKPGPRRSKGLAVGDVGGASLQRKGDPLANQDTCLSALSALRQIILTTGTLLKEDIHKRLHDVVLPLCVRLQQQQSCGGGGTAAATSDPWGQYGGAAPRRELYRLLLALVLVPPPRWPPPLPVAVSILSHGRRDRSLQVSSFCAEALTVCNCLLHPRCPSLALPLPPLTLKPPPAAPVLPPSQAPLTLPTLLGGPAPGPPFPGRHPLGLGASALLGSLENHLSLVPPGPGDLLLSSQHQADMVAAAALGAPEGQRPVFVRYDKEEAEDVEISLASDSDDSVVIVPPGMLAPDGGAAGSAGAPGPSQGGAAGTATDAAAATTTTTTVAPDALASLPSSELPAAAPASLASLVPALAAGGLGDSLPGGAQLQQMLMQPTSQPVGPLGLGLQIHQLHNQLSQQGPAGRPHHLGHQQQQQQQPANDEDSTVININSSDDEDEDEEEEDDLEDELGEEEEEEEEEGMEDEEEEEEEGSDFPEEDEEFYEGEEYDEYPEEEGEEMEDEEEEEGEIPGPGGGGRRGAMGRGGGEMLRGAAAGEEGGVGVFQGEAEGGIEELETGRAPFGDEGLKVQEVESIGVLEGERQGEREEEEEEEEGERTNDPSMPQILCVTGGAMEEQKEDEGGDDGKGVKRKRDEPEGEEQGQGTEKKKLDEEAMASMLADFVACPPDEEAPGGSGSART